MSAPFFILTQLVFTRPLYSFIMDKRLFYKPVISRALLAFKCWSLRPQHLTHILKIIPITIHKDMTLFSDLISDTFQLFDYVLN